MWIYRSILIFTFALFFSPALWGKDSIHTQQIYDVPVVAEGGRWVSRWVHVNIPPGLASFQIVILGSDNSLVQITDLVDPEGQKYVQSGSSTILGPYSQPILSNVVSPNRSEGVVPGTGTLIVPNNPQLGSPRPGRWSFRSLSRKKPKSKYVSFWLVGKFLDTADAGRIQIRVWVAPESYWSKSRVHLKKVLNKSKEYLKEAKLDLEVLSIETLPMKPAEPMKLPEDMAEIAKTMNDPDVINVYLMPEMEFQNKPINGLACIGGPAGIPLRHGCFVSMYATASADEISLQSQSKILVHELGHYLGLFHTKDAGYVVINNIFDRLSDTEEEITGKNMMDPGIHNHAPKFSPLQIKMLHLSPALKY